MNVLKILPALITFSVLMLLLSSCDNGRLKADPEIVVTSTQFDLSNNPSTIEVEVRSNVDIEVVIPEAAKNWITYIGTKALRTDTLLIKIAENKDYETRSTVVYLNNNEANLQVTITIKQYGNEPGVYRVIKMGTLSSILNQAQKDTITTMIVKGELNKADFEVMKSQMPKLRYLDLKDVKCEGDKIPDEAFGSENYANSNKYITSIIFPLCIKTIGDRAFSYCIALHGSLDIPDGLKTIGNYAFFYCTVYTGPLNLPEGLVSIGNSAFSYCTGLTGSLTLPEGLLGMGKHAFSDCSGFTGSLTLPDKLMTIRFGTFFRCKGFTGLQHLPDELVTIEGWAFRECSGFTGQLTLPAKLTTIEDAAFLDCSGFAGSLNLPESLKSIGNGVFERCTGFSDTLKIPNGLSRIGDYAFKGCSGFTGPLTLPNELTTINVNTFFGCSGITELCIGNNITTIYEEAFYDCENISGNVIFPKSIVSIRNSAFNKCNKVDAFRFPHTTPLPYYKDMLPSGATIEVPASAVDTYKATDGWKDYNIVGY